MASRSRLDDHAWIGVAFLLLMACSADDAGSPPGAEAGASGAAAPQVTPAPLEPVRCELRGPMGSPECDACLLGSCCAEVLACEADPMCSVLMGCWTDCVSAPDPVACTGGCYGNGGPPPLFIAYLDCAITDCELECTSAVP